MKLTQQISCFLPYNSYKHYACRQEIILDEHLNVGPEDSLPGHIPIPVPSALMEDTGGLNEFLMFSSIQIATTTLECSLLMKENVKKKSFVELQLFPDDINSAWFVFSGKRYNHQRIKIYCNLMRIILVQTFALTLSKFKLRNATLTL